MDFAIEAEALTEQLHAIAQQGDLEQVGEIVSRRQRILASLARPPSDHAPREDAAEVRRRMTRIQGLDQQVMQALRERKSALEDDVVKLRKGRRLIRSRP